MPEKRKDNKNRILHTGESQRKDGTYMYRYTNVNGKRKYVYSDNLNELRSKEREIQKDIDDGINSDGREMTFIELYDLFIESKHNLRHSTVTGYESRRKILVNSDIGWKKIKNINAIDVNRFIKNLQNERDLKISTLRGYLQAYKAAFDLAVKLDFVRKSPFIIQINGNETNEINDKKREALTEEQEQNVLKILYEKRNKQPYYIARLILLTGLRISEALGLTWNDVDFKNRKLKIERQLIMDSRDKIYITDTKTKAGRREIYLYDELFNFLREYKIYRNNSVDVVVDGHHDFLFSDKKGSFISRPSLSYLYKTLTQQYEKRYGEHLYITFHVLRHTFCTRLIRSGVNIKVAQYILGHSNVGVTLNIYSHVKFDDTVSNLKMAMEQ